MMRPRDAMRTTGVLLVFAASLTGCQDETATPARPAAPTAGAVQRPAPPEQPTLAEPTKIGEPTKRVSGLVYETLKEGTGPQVKPGETVTAHCVASADGAKPFFSTRETEHPVTFKLGDTRLIQGWNEGIAGMKVGERRKLTVPPNLAYGALGRLPVIPPNGTLTLEIEALALGQPGADLKAQDLGLKFTLPSTADMEAGRNEWVESPPKDAKKG